jgi:hypothetical protein
LDAVGRVIERPLWVRVTVSLHFTVRGTVTAALEWLDLEGCDQLRWWVAADLQRLIDWLGRARTAER